jgi:hypothetical protein
MTTEQVRERILNDLNEKCKDLYEFKTNVEETISDHKCAFHDQPDRRINKHTGRETGINLTKAAKYITDYYEELKDYPLSEEKRNEILETATQNLVTSLIDSFIKSDNINWTKREVVYN